MRPERERGGRATSYSDADQRRSIPYQGLPNAFLPLKLAAGALLYGVPELCVDTPPGREYAPGPGDGSARSILAPAFLFF
jgi:hypothetical protein